MKVWNLAVELYLTNSTEIRWRSTEFFEFEDEGFSLSTDFEGVLFEVGVFFEEFAEFFGAFLEDHGEFGDLCFDEVEFWISNWGLHYFYVILVRVALFLTSSAYRLSLSYWFLSSLLISKPASSLLISSWTLTESRNLKLVMDSSMRARNLKLSTKLISIQI